MTDAMPFVYLARHGETAWSLSGQHTSTTDLPLTPKGERDAARLGERLKGVAFARTLTSPLLRARRTCEIAGWPADADADLTEWHYGDAEGLTTKQIRDMTPGWDLFRDGGPNGETVGEVAARADRVLARLRAGPSPTLVVSSGHFLRVLAARWVDCDASFGRRLALSTAAVCVLGYDHALDEPVIKLWNDTRHVGE